MNKKQKRLLAGAVTAVVVCVAGVFGLKFDFLYQQVGLSLPSTPVDGDFSVHFIDVGQGDSTLIRTPEQNILIDAGEIGQGDKVVAYLRQQGVKKLDLLLATHPHSDHIGGMREVIDAFPVGQVLFSHIPDDQLPTTRVYEKLLDAIEEKQLPLVEVSPGDRFSLGGGAELSVLGPQNEDYDDLNEYSIVCRVNYGQTAVLLTGDAEKESEAALLDSFRPESLRADLLKLGHHGSDTSNTAKFLRAVAPRYAVASVGQENDYGHPHPAVVARLEKQGIALYRTDRDESVVFESNGKALAPAA